MVNCLMSWFVCAKDTSFRQTMQAININKKPDTTAESHLNQAQDVVLGQCKTTISYIVAKALILRVSNETKFQEKTYKIAFTFDIWYMCLCTLFCLYVTFLTNG